MGVAFFRGIAVARAAVVGTVSDRRPKKTDRRRVIISF